MSHFTKTWNRFLQDTSHVRTSMGHMSALLWSEITSEVLGPSAFGGLLFAECSVCLPAFVPRFSKRFSAASVSSLQGMHMVCNELSSHNGVLRWGAMPRVGWQQMEYIRVYQKSSPSAHEVRSPLLAVLPPSVDHWVAPCQQDANQPWRFFQLQAQSPVSVGVTTQQALGSWWTAPEQVAECGENEKPQRASDCAWQLHIDLQQIPHGRVLAGPCLQLLLLLFKAWGQQMGCLWDIWS